MKKNLSLVLVLLFSIVSFSACSSKDNNENMPSTANSNNTKPSTGNKNDPMSEISEKDIVKKTRETIGGQEVIRYELKDGSIILGTTDEDDIDKVNEAIRDSNNQ